jgi:hypothetical protein
MKDVHIVIGVLALVLNAAAGVWGAWRFWRAAPSTWFWRLLRAGQVAVVLEAALGGIYELKGPKAPSIHLIYGLLPLLVSFVAEQLRIGSADAILAARDYDSAADVGELPPEEQRVVVLSIVRREMGVMTVACFVVVAVALRAATTSGAF